MLLIRPRLFRIYKNVVTLFAMQEKGRISEGFWGYLYAPRLFFAPKTVYVQANALLIALFSHFWGFYPNLQLLTTNH